MLGFLAVHADAPQPRQRLAASFWPDSTEQQARTNLRRELHHLRMLLGDDRSLVVGPATLMWRESPTCRVDVCVFHHERQLALQALAAGDHHKLLEHGAAAVEEYRGDLLPGMYDDWVLAEREELRRQCVELCDHLVAGWRAAGDLRKAVDYGRLRVRLEPLEEVGYRTLMELQADAGDRAGAISTFHKCAEILDQELQVKPSQATETFAERLLSSDGPEVPPVRGDRHARALLAQRARLVGRDREFDQVLEFWNSVGEGTPRLLVVTGDAGVGKSRLISELAHKARTDGAVVATTRCFGMAGALALKPAADWLRHPRIQRSLATLDEIWRVEVDRLIPGAAGDTAFGKRERPVPQPIVASRAMVDAWPRHRFLEGVARGILAVDQPTLLVLDDLQWCDDETTAWLPLLLDRAAGAPLLIAATARREELADNTEVSQLLAALRSAGSLIEMELPPLGRDGVRALAAAFLERELSDEEVSLLITATGGYPLYVVEVIRSARELDQAGPLSSLADLSSVLSRRLEATSPHAREVAGLASAVGRDFTLDLLTEASDLNVDAVVRSVDELWRQGILREQPNGYDFSHDLVRDSAYASVSPPHRWLLHRRIAQSLQILHGEREDDVAAQLAEQYDRGGRPDRARHHYRRAAQLAAAVFANSEAVRCFRRCLELVAQQPPGRARDEEELNMLLEMSTPLNAIHGYSSPQLQEMLERSARLAEKLSRPSDLMSCLMGLFAVRSVQGHVTDAYEFATRALDLVEADPKTAGRAHLMLGASLTRLGQLEKALDHLERGRELSRGAVSAIMGTLPEVHGLAWSAHAQWLLGNPEQAIASCREAVAIARSADHPYSLAVALGYTATTHQLVQDRAGAGEAANELISLCERYSFSYYREWGVVVDGWLRGGEAGVVRIQQGIDKLRSAGQHARMPYWLYLLADVMVQAGDTAAARGILDAALAEAEQHDEQWWMPEVLRARARLLSRDAAVPILRQAVLLRRTSTAGRCRLAASKTWLISASGWRAAFFRLEDEPNAARTLLLLTSCGMTTTAAPLTTDLPLDELAAGVRGALTLPSDPGYDEARAVYNGAVDRRPAALVRCADVADVIACVNFAREHGMAVAIRGGGHHGGGFGVWDDALVIDLGGLRSTTVDPAAHTVRVDGGCTWGDVDHATGAFGMATPSGFISTTGVGGLTLGGGVGYLSRRFGLTVDNLLSADVVLADGSFVTASHGSHQDLFWALRGGGGNFGVVTSFTFRCHEIGNNGTVIAGPVFYDIADTEAVFRWYRELLPALPEELSGWIGVMVIAPESPLPEELWGRKVCGIVWCYTGAPEKGDDVLAAVREFGSPLLVGVQPMPYWVLQSAFDALAPKGLQWYWKSDFFTEITDEAIPVHRRYGEAIPTLDSTMHMYPISGAVTRVPEDATAFAYRGGGWAGVMAGIDPDPTNLPKITEWSRRYWEELHPTSAGGAYVNMMMEDEGEARIRASYRGNYDRLVQIKKRYDPTNFFHINQNIPPAS